MALNARLIILAATIACSNPAALPQDSVTRADVIISVRPRETFQTIAGWGTSMRLFDDPHIIGLPQNDPSNALQISATNQAEILDSLYRGIGLTRVRVAPDPAGIELVNDNDDPLSTDAGKFDFSDRKNDAFFGAVSDMKTRGMTEWWMSPIQLEPWMDENHPAEYVEWAMAVIRRWRDNGLPLSYWSLMNEPSGSSGPMRSGTYMRDVVKLLGQALKAENLPTKLVIPDDIGPSPSANLARTILTDPAARQYVAAIGYHLYGEPLGASDAIRELSQQYGIPLWMTEYYTQSWMDWATIVQRLLSEYNVTAVDYLAGFLGETGAGTSLIELRHSGTTYQGYRLTGVYYAFGNFTRYLHPGARRVTATSSLSSVLVSAFLQDGRLTVVAINKGDADVLSQIDLGSTENSGTFSIARTSETEHLVRLLPLSVSSGLVNAVLKAQSITTFSQ